MKTVVPWIEAVQPGVDLKGTAIGALVQSSDHGSPEQFHTVSGQAQQGIPTHAELPTVAKHHLHASGFVMRNCVVKRRLSPWLDLPFPEA